MKTSPYSLLCALVSSGRRPAGSAGCIRSARCVDLVCGHRDSPCADWRGLCTLFVRRPQPPQDPAGARTTRSSTYCAQPEPRHIHAHAQLCKPQQKQPTTHTHAHAHTHTHTHTHILPACPPRSFCCAGNAHLCVLVPRMECKCRLAGGRWWRWLEGRTGDAAGSDRLRAEASVCVLGGLPLRQGRRALPLRHGVQVRLYSRGVVSVLCCMSRRTS